MIQLNSDTLLFCVVIAIGVNRLFQTSGARLFRPAYVIVQTVNMGFVIGLWTFRIPELLYQHRRAELGVRLFLMCFVAWHMVRNSQARTQALRQAKEAAEFVAEREERMEEFAAEFAEGQADAPASPDQAEALDDPSPAVSAETEPEP
jgi:hypothetical protein